MYFMLTNKFLDYLGFMGGISTRYYYHIGNHKIIRFTGLFQEPAVYSTFLYMCLSLKLIKNKTLSYFDIICSLTIVASLSIYGIFLFGTLYLLFAVESLYKQSFNSKAVMIPMILTLILLLTAIYLMSNGSTFDFISSRILSALSDPSAHQRFVTGIRQFLMFGAPFQLFGAGLGNNTYTNTAGNGFYFLLLNFGFIFTNIMAFAFYMLLKSIKTNIKAIYYIIPTMLGAPLFTNPFFWLWLALLANAERYQNTSDETCALAQVAKSK